jgi:glycosyltransferase involved in cell wall biosynthesis
MHRLTLAMIVKNENTYHFRQCLESIAPYIDYYIIADNGSTDGTQQFIKDFFSERGIEGEVHDVEWVNFGHNRSEVLEMCKGKTEFTIMLDADDYIEGRPALNVDTMRKQDLDGWGLRIKRGDFTWWRNQVFRADSDWCYVGVLHEYAMCKKENPKFGRIDGDYHLEARTLGARNKKEDGSDLDFKEKYAKDAEVLLSALTNPDDPAYEPNNGRYQFYLGQSYFDSQQWEKAEEAYGKRAAMGGWLEEAFYSCFRVAICKMFQDKPWPECQDTLLQAWNMKPDRAEPLYQLAKIHRLNGNPRLGYLFSKMATDIKYPANDILFIDENVYSWMVLDEFASTAFYIGDFENGYRACEILIDKINKGQIPPDHHERIRTNHAAYAEKIRGAATQDFAIKQRIKEEREKQKKIRMEQQKKTSESKKVAKNRSKEKARRKAKASQA